MKLRTFIFVILLSLLGLQFVVGQHKQKAIKVDELPNRCNESIMASVEMFAGAVRNQPQSKGFIIFYGNENDEGNNLILIEWFKFYSKMIGHEVTVIRGANTKNPKVEFWVVPEGAELPNPVSEFVLPIFDRKIRFDLGKAFIEPGRENDLQFFHSEFGCQLTPNLSEFARILLAIDNLNGLLIVDNQNKYLGYQVSQIIVKKLTKTYKIPRHRFRLNFRYKSEFGEAQLWFVPKK